MIAGTIYDRDYGPFIQVRGSLYSKKEHTYS